MNQQQKSRLERWLTPVLSGLTLILLGSAVTTWRSVLVLQQYRDETWPLEKQLMLVEHAQMGARIAVNEANIEELENEVQELR